MTNLPVPMAMVDLAGNEEKYVADALQSGWISSIGKYVVRFEREFADYIGVRHGVSTSNGTCAIHLALAALRIGPGDEVIVPAFTFAATVNAVLHAGAEPVLVDSSADHWSMNSTAWEQAITPKTRAIIPVHLYGHPCDMTSIIEIARRHGVAVIEDAAEAHGAECLGRKVGSLSDIACFSFYANKIITTGEGGMCVTNSPELDARLRLLRDHGMRPDRKYWHDEVGFNYRLTNLNAAIGVAQLERIGNFLERRAAIARLYEQGLSDTDGIVLYATSPHGRKVDWLFCVFVESGKEADRDAMLKALKAEGLDARPTFYPLHIMPPYLHLRRVNDLGNARRFGLSGLNLPLHTAMSDGDVERIVAVVKRSARTLRPAIRV